MERTMMLEELGDHIREMAEGLSLYFGVTFDWELPENSVEYDDRGRRILEGTISGNEGGNVDVEIPCREGEYDSFTVDDEELYEEIVGCVELLTNKWINAQKKAAGIS